MEQGDENLKLKKIWEKAHQLRIDAGDNALDEIQKRFTAKRQMLYKSEHFSTDLLHPLDHIFHLVTNPMAAAAIDPDLKEEITATLLYVIERYDIVPDYVPGTGFRDDEIIIQDMTKKMGLQER